MSSNKPQPPLKSIPGPSAPTEELRPELQTTEDLPRADRHLIVGIGASAGGLAAFRAFLAALPSDTGMAFVLVQHLDPDYESSLAEILRDATALPVIQAKDGTVAAPDTVSVIAPNAILKIEKGVLRMAIPETPTARRSSIDTFLVSLANDQGESAVGIILSGYGSDGTIGIGAIKEHGGLTMSEAEFDHHAKRGMPQSAAAGGFVDRILPVHEMPSALLEYQSSRLAFHEQVQAEGADSELRSQLMTICSILHSRLGRDFTEYKTNTLLRRVLRRMQILRIGTTARYIDQLRSHPEEPELLFREFLIGVTRFFRDPAMFDALADTLVRELIGSRRGHDEPIRVWVPGCATGEEAYSIAILFKEELLRAECTRGVTIFATDIDERAVRFARAGLYTDAIEAEISAARLADYFIKEGQHYRVAKQIREMCVFSAHDLVKDPPFSRLDLISCRNLLIYFGAQLQRRVLATFHYGLKPQGVLWLGPSEAIVTSSRLFRPIDKRRRLFSRVDVPAELPAPSGGRLKGKAVASSAPKEFEALDQEIARTLTHFIPAYMIVDGRLEIHRFSGPIAKFLEPATGNAKLNVMKLLHAELRSPAASVARRAIESEKRVQEKATIQLANVSTTVNIIAEPISTPIAGENCILLVFEEAGSASLSTTEDSHRQSKSSDSNSESELIAAREKLQTVSEELATANEELQSSNEEFQSVNEELHSTVEELETSKEELQSINEELHTVNAELTSRAEILARTNSDLINLFDSTSIATLFLDRDFRIRRFTPAVSEIFNLREGDEGRSLADFSSRLSTDAILSEARAVLKDLTSIERELECEDDSSTYLLRVKPYRTVNNVIDGVVITLVDMTERKRFERDRAYLAAIVQSSEDAIIGHDLEGHITSWNLGAQMIFGYSESEMIGQPVSILLDEQQLDEWPQHLACVRRGESIANFDVRRVAKDNRGIDVSLKISPIRNSRGDIIGASAVGRDISQRKAAEERAALLMAELDHRVKNILAVVASIVSQTLNAGGSLQQLKEEIEGRIAAVARAQGLLTGHGGVEGSLSGLIAIELSPYESRCNIVVKGEDVTLTSKASLILALAIHELATNAAKYGALSVAAGRLEVNWGVTVEGDQPQLTLNWVESGGPTVAEPSRRGFGTKLIELSVGRGLGASVRRDFLAAGLNCQIKIPLSEDIGRVDSARSIVAQ